MNDGLVFLPLTLEAGWKQIAGAQGYMAAYGLSSGHGLLSVGWAMMREWSEEGQLQPMPWLEAMCYMDGAPPPYREMLKWEEIAPDQLLLLSREDECRSIAG